MLFVIVHTEANLYCQVWGEAISQMLQAATEQFSPVVYSIIAVVEKSFKDQTLLSLKDFQTITLAIWSSRISFKLSPQIVHLRSLKNSLCECTQCSASLLGMAKPKWRIPYYKIRSVVEVSYITASLKRKQNSQR